MPSKRVQVAIVLGLAILLAGLDWAFNGRWGLAVTVAGAIALGLIVRIVRLAQRRCSDTDDLTG